MFDHVRGRRFPSPQIETPPRRAGACPLSNEEPHHLRSRLLPEGQGRAPCPTRKLSTSGWLRLSQIECSALANREDATSRPRTDRPMRRKVATKGGLSRLSTKKRGGGSGRGERLCARWWSAKASAHGVVGATEGLLLPAFALPTSVRLEPVVRASGSCWGSSSAPKTWSLKTARGGQVRDRPQ